MEKLLARLNELEIGLEVQEGNLDIYDPKDNLTDELIGTLKENKAEILKLFGGVQGDYEFNAIPKAEEKEYYQLSSAQKRMYFLYEFDKDSLAYNVPEVIPLGQELDKDKLIKAFKKLIQRHEILRTSFHVVDEEPVQKIDPEVSFDIERYSTSKRELISVVQDFVRPFDLTHGPLLRVGLVQTSAKDQYLLIDMHHIISDGVSAGIMDKDFMALYAGQSLPPLKLQYKDYAEWQQSAAHQKEIETQKSFWLNQFEDASPVLELPTDISRPIVKGADGNTFYFDITTTETAKLKLLAKQEKTTLYTVALSLFYILLNKLGNEEDIVIGTPVAGRQHADLENIIGLFVNTLPIRHRVKGDFSFNEFLSKVKNHVLQCFENQSFQYEELVELLDVKRSTNRNPLFDCLFAMDNFGDAVQGNSTDGNNVFENDSEEGIAKFDLSLTAIEANDKLTFQFEYSTELFEKPTIERFATYFKTIVSSVLSNVDIRISDIQLMPEEEMNRILFDFNDTAYDYPKDKSVLKLFEEHAIRTPDQIALLHNERTLTYRELDERANQLANYLLTQSEERKPLIGLLMDKSMEVIIGMLAILKTGGAYLPLDMNQPDKRTLGILQDANVKLLLTQSDKLPFFENHIKSIDILTNQGVGYSVEKPEVNSQQEDLAYVIYTSGSTGKPKGVKIRHAGITNLVCAQTPLYGLTNEDRVFQFSSLVFDASVEQIWFAFANGAGLVLTDREVILNNTKFNKFLYDYKITHFDVTPSFLESVDLEDQKYLKRIAVGGEACKPDTIRKYAARYKVYNSYGPTEATVTAAVCELTEKWVKKNKFPIGKPLGNYEAYVLDKHQSLVPIGVAGELHLGGIGLAEGYLNAPKLTDEKFIPHPFKDGEKLYKTGDLTRWLEDGDLEYLGRIDSQVKIRGFRIELGEIESALNLYEGIKECAVIAKERNGENYLCAYYVGSSELESKVLRKYLSEQLPDYMVPAYFVAMERMPLNSSRKLNVKLLPTPEFSTEEDFVGPANDTEEKLRIIWSEVLKINASEISVTKSFFELGGHSLKATVLVNKILKTFEVEVPLKEIFLSQSIEQLAAYIQSQRKTQFVSIPKAAEKAYYKLSSAQKRMYFLYEFERESLAYNMPEVIRLEEGMDRKTLLNLFEQLISRHEILRTTFHIVDEEPVQLVAQKASLEIEMFQTNAAEINKLVDNFVRPFDLKKGPLLRLGIAQISSNEQYLILDMHHIISDGVSADIMYNDFKAIFAGASLPPLKLQYKDYAEWQQSAAHQEEITAQKSFWLEQFEEASPALELPTDFVRPIVKENTGSAFHFEISEQQTLELKKLAKQEKTTLYTIALSIFNILLSKLSNEEDIIIGTPVAGRQHADLENIIGLFVNTLPLRNKVKGDFSFSSFLSKVKIRTLECFENQSFQYEELVELLDVKRSTNRNPLFDCLFSMDNFGSNDQGGSGEKNNSSENEPQEGIAKFDLSLTAVEESNQLVFEFEYSTELFEKQTIERFATYFKAIISSVLSNLDVLISDIQIIPLEERNRILHDFNDSKFDYPKDKTVLDLFEEQVLERPDQVALYYNDQTLTFQQVDERANQLAHYLLAQCETEKPIVGLLMDKSMELLIGMLAILKTGGAYLPLDVNQPDKRTLGILENAKATLLLTNRDEFPVYENHIKTIDVLTKEIDDCSSLKPAVNSRVDDIAYIIYTSGSTGKPKGVKIKHEGVTNMICAQSRTFEITEQDRVFQFSSLVFDASVEQIWIGWTNGAGLVLADREVILSNVKFREFLHKYKVTHFDVTPTFLESVNLEDQKYLKRIVLGGEACKPDTVKKYANQIRMYNSYGPTEATVTSTMCEFTPDLVKANRFPIGKPLDNYQVYVLDKYQSIVPIGVAGELYIGGIGLAAGYLNAPELTDQKFVPHPFKEGEKLYKTGDLTRWLDDGNLEFLGRIDTQVKIRGFRIELGEIESTLNLFEDVKECAVIAKERNGDNYLCAYYVGEVEVKANALRKYLSEQLPEYMVPAYFVALDRMPLNSSRKLDAKQLPAPEFGNEEDYVGPSNNTEKELQTIWSEVLKLDAEHISVTKSFFELGGHSLKATVLVNKLLKKFEVEVPLKEIFLNQSVERLASYIRSQQKTQFVAIPKAAEKAYYKLSSAQKRMYFLNEFDKDSLAYNMPEVIRFEEQLDKGKLLIAFNELISRHEIFRTSFKLRKGEPVQKVAQVFSFDIELFNTSTSELNKVVQEFVRPFDLKNGPLLRVGIARTSTNEHYLLLDMHHIISDGVSAEIMYKDFVALYAGESLPPQKLQYKDYAEWQQSSAHQDKIAPQKSFWLRQFETTSPVLEIPTDFNRPLTKNFAGSSFHFEITKKQTADLKQIARQEKTTLYTVVFSIFNILLNKLSNEEDIVIGTPVAGRQHIDLENIIGLFVNTLPLRNQVKGEISFNDFLSAVKRNVLECFEHQSFQYEELVELLDLKRSTNRNPLFDYFFAMDNFEDNASGNAIDEHKPADNEPDEELAKFDLSLSAIEIDKQLVFDFEYSTELFERQTIERFAIYFKTILSSVIANLDLRISDIQPISKAEKNRILFDFNDTALAFPKDKTVVDLFEEQVAKHPEQGALFFNHQILTYQEVDERANQLAHYLLTIGAGRRRVIGLLIDKSIEMLIGVMAILKTGSTYLPLDVNQPKDRVLGILQDANAIGLLTQEDKIPQYKKAIKTIDVLAKEADNFGKQSPATKVAPDDIAYIIYTSGSTGKPKGVEIKHSSITNLICSQTASFGMTNQDRIFQFSSIAFDASVEQIWLALTNGAGLVFANREVVLSNTKFGRFLNQNKITHLDVTPSFLESINLDGQKYLKRIVLGGEVCKPETVKKYTAQYKVYNAYGPTEATVTAVMCELTEAHTSTNKLPIGKPLSNTQIYILDKYKSVVPVGVVGELFIGGAGLAKGYLNAPTLTAEKFIAHPFKEGEKLYRSGDLACWLADGNIAFMGRKDKQVKIRGFRIELGEIENSLNIFEDIKECAVVANERNGENYLCAYYVEKKEIKSGTLRQFLSGQLPDYMVPAYFVALDRIPLNRSGKLNEKQLPAPEFEDGGNYVEPGNDTEREMQAIWSAVLKLDQAQISVTKSFFELGGHSLKAIQLLSSINNTFKVEVALLDIFQHQTIRALSEKIHPEKDNVLLTNETLTLLKQCEQSTDNLFFIHDGSGDVQGYMELIGLIKDFNCWGLRRNNLNQYGPQHIRLEEMAASYIEELRKVQKSGPYKIVGWSIGGNIAYEVVRQLEAMGEYIDQFIIIDAQIPFGENNNSKSRENNFSLTKERKMIRDVFGVDTAFLAKEKSVAALWGKVMEYVENNNLDIEEFRNKIPEDIRYLIPYFENLDIKTLIATINSIRTLDQAIEHYLPGTKLNTKVIYFKASESDLNLDDLSTYFKEEIAISEIAGDHFSILQSPQVQLLESKMNHHLNSQNEESTLI